MKYRRLGPTELEVSEVGFGVWTVSTSRWGNMQEADGMNLLLRAYELGVTFFDTADTYGDGYGEVVLAKALRRQRHDIVIATKFGYDLYAKTIEQDRKKHPQNFAPGFIRYACEQSLRRLNTDYIDLYQLHHPRMDALESDEAFDTLDQLVKEGKARYYGFAIGSDMGWLEEGKAAMKERKANAMQLAYSILEQRLARDIFPIAQDENTGLIAREPHSSGLLDGTPTRDSVPGSAERPNPGGQDWLESGLEKVEQLDFLKENLESTLGQSALKFALSGPMVAVTLPNITNITQLEEFAATSETEDIPQEFLKRLSDLYDECFNPEPEEETPVAN